MKGQEKLGQGTLQSSELLKRSSHDFSPSCSFQFDNFSCLIFIGFCRARQEDVTHSSCQTLSIKSNISLPQPKLTLWWQVHQATLGAMVALKLKNQNLPVWWCGGVVVVVWWCGGGGGGGFFTDYNTTLRLHQVTLGCGNNTVQ